MESLETAAGSARIYYAERRSRPQAGPAASLRIDRPRRRCRAGPGERTVDAIRLPVNRQRRDVYVRVNCADRRRIYRLCHGGPLAGDRASGRLEANGRRRRELATLSDGLFTSRADRAGCHLRRCTGWVRDGARRYSENDGWRRALDHDQDAGDLATRSGALSLGLAARVDSPVALVEVLRAERADAPLRSDELAAVRADPLEPRAAGRAEDEFFLHAFLTSRTDDTLLRLGEQALLRELTRVGLTERLLRRNDEIKEEAEDVEDDHHQAGEVRKELVLGPLLRVADGPEHHREVDREDVQTRQPNR